MTPILSEEISQVATSGMSMTLGPTCEICENAYERLPLQKLQIKETYGMAIFNEGQAIKVVREAHKHS